MSERRGTREWVVLTGLILVAATFSVLTPGVLLAVPFALLALALPPRRPLVIATGVVLLALIVSGSGEGTLWYFERGWSLLVGAWFVVWVMALPRAGFVNRALGAITSSIVSAGVFLALNRGALERLDRAVTDRLRLVAADAATAVGNMMRGSGGQGSADMSANMLKAADLQAHLFPALVSLATLASLGAGWWVFRRIAARDSQPLRPLREFRFSDHLVWVFVTGALLLIVPDDELAKRAGANLIAFMAALYSLRGLAVMVVIGGSPGPLGVIFGAVMFVFLYPLVVGATIIVGLTDTWLDIRARRPAMPTSGS